MSATETENPSWLSAGSDGRIIYAVNENHEGSVSSFFFDGDSGRLTLMNKVSSGGSEPCYIATYPVRNQVITGNYGDGSFSVIPLTDNGCPGPEITTIKNEGSGIDRLRQEGPHVHCTVISPDNRWLLVTDLGTDRVYIYRFDGSGKPVPKEPSFISVMPGSGPRILLFHPDSGIVYLIHEMGGFITVYDLHYGRLELKQNISLLSPVFKGEISAADIQISPDGRYLYASNRGDANEIVIFSIGKNGLLRIKGRQSSMGETPRNLVIDPSGNFLLAANQDSDEIMIFRRNKKSGLLTKTNSSISVRKPVFLEFI